VWRVLELDCWSTNLAEEGRLTLDTTSLSFENRWTINIFGSPGTLYAGKKFKLQFVFPGE